MKLLGVAARLEFQLQQTRRGSRVVFGARGLGATIIMVLALVLRFGPFATAYASIIYEYNGKHYNYFDTSLPLTSEFSSQNFVHLEIELADPLQPNLTYSDTSFVPFNPQHKIVNWEVGDGNVVMNENNAYLVYALFETNSSANIQEWALAFTQADYNNHTGYNISLFSRCQPTGCLASGLTDYSAIEGGVDTSSVFDTGFAGADTQGNWIVSQENSVPEPSTWVIMLLGFACLGYAGCRRARAA